MKLKTTSQSLADFGSTVKRTRTALHSLKDELLRKGVISEKEAEALLKAAAVLARIAPSVDVQKAAAKKKEAEDAALLERLTREAREAVAAALKDIGMEDSVAFLVFRRRSLSYVEAKMPLKTGPFDNDVLDALRAERNDEIRDLVSELAWNARKSNVGVSELLTEMQKDIEAMRPKILERFKPFMERLKTAAAAQALHKVNK